MMYIQERRIRLCEGVIFEHWHYINDLIKVHIIGSWGSWVLK